jgi:hypothetical protein
METLIYDILSGYLSLLTLLVDSCEQFTIATNNSIVVAGGLLHALMCTVPL